MQTIVLADGEYFHKITYDEQDVAQPQCGAFVSSVEGFESDLIRIRELTQIRGKEGCGSCYPRISKVDQQ